jgi:RHS repeat-associated protein
VINLQLGKNSRPGFERRNHTPRPGFATLKSQTIQRNSWHLGGRTATGPSVYLYDGAMQLEELDATGNLGAGYTHGNEMDEPLAERRSGVPSYFEQDALGSSTSLSNSNGTLSNTYTYDSFGRLSASTGNLVNPVQYTGREFDSETTLFYFRARYYDRNTGRFVSEDPSGFAGGFNFYAYVQNDPNDSADPSGLCPSPCNDLPAHPQDANVIQNMWQAQDNGYRWWYRMVTNGNGPWDYKYYHHENHHEYDDFGNFNYGATGCALGIPLNILLRGAGWAKSRLLVSDPYGNPLWRYPYGNQPDKQEQVIKGYEYCKKCMPADGGWGGGGSATNPGGGGGGAPF